MFLVFPHSFGQKTVLVFIDQVLDLYVAASFHRYDLSVMVFNVSEVN